MCPPTEPRSLVLLTNRALRPFALNRHRGRFHVYITYSCKSFMPTKQDQRVVLELFGDDVPYTAENFRRLCCNEGVDGSGYKGSFVHHVTSETEVRGGRLGGALTTNAMGGLVLPLTGAGAGQSASAFGGRPFRDENFKLDHDVGTVSSVSVGGAHGSEFFVNMTEEDDFLADRNNGEHVVFGRVVEGMQAVRDISALMRSEAWTTLIQKKCLKNYQMTTGRPADPITISDCGELEDYTPPQERGARSLAEGGLFKTKRRTQDQADKLMKKKIAKTSSIKALAKTLSGKIASLGAIKERPN